MTWRARRLSRLAACALAIFAGCSRAGDPSPRDDTLPSAAASAGVAPSSSVAAGASARPVVIESAVPGPALVGLRWAGLRTDRPMVRSALSAGLSGREPEKGEGCRSVISFDLIAGEGPTAFEARLETGWKEPGDAQKSGSDDPQKSGNDDPRRRWSGGLAPRERRRVSLGPFGCGEIFQNLFEPSPATLTLTVKAGDRVLLRYEVRRQAVEAISAGLSPAVRFPGYQLYDLRPDPPLPCDQLPATTALSLVLASIDRGQLHVSLSPPGQPLGVTPRKLSPEDEVGAVPKPHDVVIPRLAVPRDACRGFPSFGVSWHEDVTEPASEGRPAKVRRGGTVQARLRFVPEEIRVLAVDRTADR